jgi:hypothetical protein
MTRNKLDGDLGIWEENLPQILYCTVGYITGSLNWYVAGWMHRLEDLEARANGETKTRRT